MSPMACPGPSVRGRSEMRNSPLPRAREEVYLLFKLPKGLPKPPGRNCSKAAVGRLHSQIFVSHHATFTGRCAAQLARERAVVGLINLENTNEDTSHAYTKFSRLNRGSGSIVRCF